MLLDQNPGLQLRATKPKPLLISILVHILLIALLAINPNWFETSHRRTIRIAGEDFDLSRLELTPLTLPPRIRAPAAPVPRPAPAPPEPLVQPQQATPPPPPPPPPPTPPPPDRVIRPDDLLAEGARPDGSPRASRGNTQDQARAGGSQDQQGQQAQSQEAQQAQEARQAQRGSQGQNGPNRILPNTNPNALKSPSLLASAGEIVEAQLDAARRNQSLGRTGIARGDNNGTFSTEPQILSPNPKGIDFGPYMNQLLNRLRANWISVMPESARLGQRGRVDIVFTVTKSGIVKDLHVVVNSGAEVLDKTAVSAIQLSNPFQQLPAEYETDLRLRIAFLYNMYP
jgi:TonB family protein